MDIKPNDTVRKVLEELTHDYLLDETDFITLQKYMENEDNPGITYLVSCVESLNKIIDVPHEDGTIREKKEILRDIKRFETVLLNKMRKRRGTCII